MDVRLINIIHFIFEEKNYVNINKQTKKNTIKTVKKKL
jgi:hypothetical protein